MVLDLGVTLLVFMAIQHYNIDSVQLIDERLLVLSLLSSRGAD